jgi:hypothetical protein
MFGYFTLSIRSHAGATAVSYAVTATSADKFDCHAFCFALFHYTTDVSACSLTPTCRHVFCHHGADAPPTHSEHELRLLHAI